MTKRSNVAKDDPILVDGLSILPDGMNSGLAPQLLQPTQTSFSTNATHRGGFIKNRPGFRKVTLTFDGGLVDKQNFETGLWQGGAFFKSEYGTESLVCAISGMLYEIVPDSDISNNSATVFNISIPGDTNAPGNAIAWLWQSERWMIINDGESLPIFYDGKVARRSQGPSVILGTTAVDWVAPAIGASVLITLAADYPGPYNSTIFIDGAFYQINSSTSGYAITLKNLGAPAGTVTSGTLIQIPSNLLSVVSGGSSGNSSATVGQPATSFLNVPGNCPAKFVFLALGNLKAIVDKFVTITTSTGGSVSGKVTRRQVPDPLRGQVNDPTNSLVLCGAFQAGVVLPINAPIFSGYTGTFSIAGTVSTDFAIPAIGASTSVFITTPYNGVLPQQVVINGFLYEITATNNTPATSNIVSATNINDTAGTAHGPATPSTPGILSTIAELPVGRMGAYGMGRNWMCLADGRSFIASDIVGGPSGSPSVNNRDSVLRITENDFLNGGGVFVVPGNVGDIQSMVFTANLDVSLGQGPLQVGTSTTIFSCQAPVDRTTWQTISNPILTESLKGKGPLGQYGTILVNSDTLFRASDGIGSLILARRDFTSWGNVPISREMQRVIDVDNITLLGNATAVQFDNRLLMGCLPFRGNLGVYHQGIIALNFDPVSSLRGKAASIYDGLWTGLQAFQIIAGKFAGDERAFSFCFESLTNKIILSELAQSGEDEFDNSTNPITWSFESASLFKNVKKGPFDPIELADGEIYLSDIQGVVTVQSWYRPNYSQCWIPWHQFTICGTPNTPKQFRNRLGLGQPTANNCEPTNNRPYRIGETFQVRFQITGACRFDGAIFKAARLPETYWAKAQCDTLCDITDSIPCEPCKEQGPCETFDLVFYNLNGNKVYSNDAMIFQVLCPDGTEQSVVIPAGVINYAFPFPPDFEGEYPPIVLGCAAGGNIVRQVPTGATQEEIDAIVNGMISQCAQAMAEANVVCFDSTQFSNEEVFFLHDCGADDLTYSGTLPTWITLDVPNSQLVGAAGTFNSNSQASANLIAQNAIDNFGNSSLTSGDLFCSAACTTLPSAFTDNALASVGDGAFATGNNLLMLIIDPGAAPTFNTYDVTGAGFVLNSTTGGGAGAGGWSVGYIEYSGNKKWIGFSGQRQLFKRATYDPLATETDTAVLTTDTGVQLSVACNNTTGIAYGNTRFDLCRFDVAAGTTSLDSTGGGIVYFGQMAVDETNNYLLVSARTTPGGLCYVSVRNGTTLAEVTQVAMPTSSARPCGIVFRPDTGKMYVAANDGGGDGGDVVYVFNNYVLSSTIRLLSANWASLALIFTNNAVYNTTAKQACFSVSKTGPTVGGIQCVCTNSDAYVGFIDTTAVARTPNVTYDDLNNQVIGSGFGRVQGFQSP